VNAVYTVRISGVSDLSGTTSSTLYTSTFTTSGEASVATPTAALLTPTSGATGVLTTTAVQLQFSSPMNAISLTSQTIALSVSGGAAVPGTVTVNPAGTVATFMPSAALATSTTYSIIIGSGATDLTGRTANYTQFSFTTGTQ
jgi:hypothetical protein